MIPLIQHQEIQDTKSYIIGKRKPSLKHALHIGRFYALDGSLGAPVYVDVSSPHVLLIAGKRGYGKSYTMGVFLEEFNRLPLKIRQKYCVVVIDTLGIFWTLAYPNEKQYQLLKQWNIKSEYTQIRILHTSQYINDVHPNEMNSRKLMIPPKILSVNQWCELFELSLVQPEARVLINSILSLQSKKQNFSIEDIIKEIKNISTSTNSIQTIESYLQQAQSWNIFSADADLFLDLVKPGEITIIDLSSIKSNHLKQIITGIIAEQLFYFRVNQRKIEEYGAIKKIPITQSPYIWLAIDEAHLFIPKNQSSYVKKVLLHNWLRQGRQPGLSVILATQRPSFMDQEVLSHSDLVLCHRLTSCEDIESLTQIRPIYMKEDIQATIKQIGIKKGVALLIDDVVETSHVIQIRPRYSWHGGGEPNENLIEYDETEEREKRKK